MAQYNEINEAYSKIALSAPDREERQNSRIIHLRTFNNWVKSYLIDMYTPMPNACIFDCACGRGGDLQKWSLKNQSSFLFADVARQAIGKLYQRLSTGRNKNCDATFIIGDSYSHDIAELLAQHSNEVKTFQIASCQFAFHYAFIDEKQLVKQHIICVVN